MGVQSFEDFNKLTFYELHILEDAFQLKAVDEDRAAHWQAFLNYQVTGTKKGGKPVYKNFGKFYDYEKELARVKGQDKKETKKINDIGKILYGGE